MKILIIDNYDSFTFNLVQLIGNYVNDITVKRNDRISLDEISDMKPDKIVISPGPGNPDDSGISLNVIKTFGVNTPLLGVCLGHQGIGFCFGAKIINAPYLMHGKVSNINHDGKTIYKNVEQNFGAGRYHSLVIEKESIPAVLEITSHTGDGIVMGVRHINYPIEGIQFHPESILTKAGDQIIKNWIEL
ncbi:MAG: aminodeoxychorismate/anthranilate synthase component II [Ignavibacteriae bacterium HGW-Ignavibacteriae-3]|nr:MAG: aminodeoxychorismate/anthranilate synthase component II [Ignavibacteriae bacterium HGW-Ignavibacteriae-3]